MPKYNQYKNLFVEFKDTYMNFKHFCHYVENMNSAKTGCYFLHNLNLALLNLIILKNTIKHSSKKIDNVMYYQIQLPKLLTNFLFADFKENKTIYTSLSKYNLNSLKNNFNKTAEYLNSNKFSKSTLIDNLNQLEKYMWVLYKAFQNFINEYEKQF